MMYNTLTTIPSRFRSSMKHCLLSVGIFLLVPGMLSAASQPMVGTTSQHINTRSFHETTELAETLWADLTNRFVGYYEKGDLTNALLVAQRAYEIANNNFGLEDVNTADALLKLGIVHQTLGKLIQAEDELLGSLVILEEKLSPDHPDVAVVMTNLGNVYFDLQRPEESEKYHQQARQIRINAFGESDPSVAQSTYNLAVLYENQQDYDKAANYYRQAIDSWSASIGPTHPYVGNALNNLANIYNIQNKYAQAASVLQRTLDFKKSVYGARHEEVAQTLISLGTNYLEQGAYRPASNAYEEALDIAQRVLPASDPQLALLMYTLANIYHTRARIEEQNQQRNASGDTASSGAVANSKVSMTTVGNNSHTTTLFAQALPLYEKAVEILDAGSKTGEPEAQSALDVVLSELAMLYQEIGNKDMAQATKLRIATH
ncbi:MAG TPA: tetratricopeptide repeat protein [Gammaproteobacteria bacterium]|nr:tetratricopeptide repeat protein [Gammaproteobacteria bacterium]